MDDINDSISININSSDSDSDSDSRENGVDSDDMMQQSEAVARSISKIMIDNTTSMKKLFTLLLECNDDIKYKNNILIQNKIDSITKDLEEEMDLFIKRCKPIIDQKFPIPVLVREKSNELLLDEENPYIYQNITPTKFSKGMKAFMSDLLNRQIFDTGENFRGLDCDRDTEQELENVLRIYPDVLEDHPSIFDCHSMKYITFIPIVAQLRIELCKNLNPTCRGGILGKITAISQSSTRCPVQKAMVRLFLRRPEKQEENQLLDHRVVSTMRRLKVMGLFKKVDIQNQNLLNQFLRYEGGKSIYFSHETFQFLVTWDPVQLITGKNHHTRQLPLHHAAHYCTLECFQAVFEAGLRYFPRKMGMYILFLERSGHTPFDRACCRYGRENVLEVIESNLNKCSANPYDAAEVLFIAATDEDISIDGIYFLLRRTPNVVQKLSRSNSATYIEECDVDTIDIIDIIIKEEKEFQEVLYLEKHIDIYITSHDDYWYAQYDDYDNRKRIRDGGSNTIRGHDHDYSNKRSRET
jgi:hypothetical protein